MDVRIKRVYEPASTKDGVRVLVDRLWPRGVSKEKAKIDLWLKDIAPSDELRKKFHHDVSLWGDFRKEYRKELSQRSELIDQLKKLAKDQVVTLVYAASDTEHNNAEVLLDYLLKQ